MYDNQNADLTARIALLEEQNRTQADMIERQHLTNNTQADTINALIKEKTDLEAEVADQREISKLHESTSFEEMQRRQAAEREAMRFRAEAQLLRDNWASDVREISAAFRREAIDRDWCEEAAEFIHDLNRTLHGPLTPPRTTYDVTVQVLVSVDVTVEAYDEDDARQIAADEWRNLWTDRDYDAREIIDNGTTQAVETFDVSEA